MREKKINIKNCPRRKIDATRYKNGRKYKLRAISITTANKTKMKEENNEILW